jgi:hypothetical protein
MLSGRSRITQAASSPQSGPHAISAALPSGPPRIQFWIKVWLIKARARTPGINSVASFEGSIPSAVSASPIERTNLLSCTRPGAAADPHTKNVFEKNLVVFFLRITEGEGKVLLVITCRFATLPRALFDEGDDERLVGSCDRGLRPKQRSQLIEHRRACVAGRCVRGGTKARINSKRATFMARLLPLKDVKRGLFDTGGVTWTAFVLVTHLSGRAQQLMTGPDTGRRAQADGPGPLTGRTLQNFT